jgi:serine/threonine-protein kinase
MEDPTKTQNIGAPQEQLGRYHLLTKLGQGGMGAVYKAQDTRLDRLVALKTISQVQSDPSAIQRFQREAKVCAKLHHPHIVTLYDFEEIEGIFFLTMDFIDGCSLEELLAKQSLPLTKVCKIMGEILDAVEYAHGQGIVHRDLKPSNILIDKQGKPFVTDFGLAKAMYSSSVISQPGTVLGTPAYMSPEQAQGEQTDVRSDVFSLGVILYQMITGSRPFDGENVFAILHCLVNGKFKKPREIVPQIPEALERICVKALAKEREHRYQTAQEMANDVHQYLANEAATGSKTAMRRSASATGEKTTVRSQSRKNVEQSESVSASKTSTRVAPQRPKTVRRENSAERGKPRQSKTMSLGTITLCVLAIVCLSLVVLVAGKSGNKTAAKPAPATSNSERPGEPKPAQPKPATDDPAKAELAKRAAAAQNRVEPPELVEDSQDEKPVPPESPQGPRSKERDEHTRDALRAFIDVMKTVREGQLQDFIPYCAPEYVAETLQTHPLGSAGVFGLCKLWLHIVPRDDDKIMEMSCIINQAQNEVVLETDNRHPWYNLVMVKQQGTWKFAGRLIEHLAHTSSLKAVTSAAYKPHHKQAEAMLRRMVAAVERRESLDDFCQTEYVGNEKKQDIVRVLTQCLKKQKNKELPWETYNTLHPEVVVFVLRYARRAELKIVMKVENNKGKIIGVSSF